MKKGSKIVVALGGNAISPKGEIDTIANQFNKTRKSLSAIKHLIDHGYEIVITHGNGPQVGNAILRTELTEDQAPLLPLGYCVADIEGGMGYMIQQSLHNLFKREGLHKEVVTIITQVLVDKNDPEISSPSKFIGRRYNNKHAEELSRKYGWIIRQTSDGKWRRTVPSPKPISIIESNTICELVDAGKVVIAAGGGGIPVYIRDNGDLEGFDAVVDKDLSSCILAKAIGAHHLLIITNIDNVYINFGQSDQKPIYKMAPHEARQYMKEGHFASGTMKPKIDAALQFIDNGGESVLITSIENFQNGLKAGTGTVISVSDQ